MDYLAAMGIQRWAANEMWLPLSYPVAQGLAVSENQENALDQPVQLSWQQLQQQVAACQQCGLHQTRTQTVFGVGNHQASCLIVGEAPGADEDKAGEPFVGRAGQLLNAILFALGIERSMVYIANVLKCRPPQNRDPHAEEIACCQHFLQAQIRLLQPKLIIAVGRIAAFHLVPSHSSSLGALRGRCHRYQDTDIPVIVTYHPAYLLRSPQEKRRAWRDWLSAQAVLQH